MLLRMGRRQTYRPRGLRSWSLVVGMVAACAISIRGSEAHAQSIEPRSYSPAPVDVNFLVTGYAASQGALSFDDSVPLTDAKVETRGPVLAYARTLDLWGKLGKLDVILPFAELSGTAIYQGEPLQRQASGLADPLLRLSVVLYGAPAMTATEFRSYKQDLVVGASVQVSVPIGQYDHARAINLGANRWFVKPSIGVSKAAGRWTFEANGAVTFFSANGDFFGGNKVTRKPIYSAQGHLIYSFRSGVWASADATFYTGGRTTLNGTAADNLEQNIRAGATLALPINRRSSIKLYASTGVSARTGNNFDLFGAAWQYRWGGGL